MHIHRMHSKAPVDFRKLPGFLGYALWEENQFPSSKYPPERALHVPDEKKIAAYHQINKTLRIRLCHVSRLPSSPRKDALIRFIYKRIDDNMGYIFHERDPKNCPDLRQEFMARAPVQKEKPVAAAKEAAPRPAGEEHKGILLRLPVLRRFPNPEAEPALTGTDAYSV